MRIPIPATIFYAFKATESTEGGVTSTGWETFLHGLLSAVLDYRHMASSHGARRGLKVGKSMLASSIVLACRQRRSLPHGNSWRVHCRSQG